jgi:hypothetical protein
VRLSLLLLTKLLLTKLLLLLPLDNWLLLLLPLDDLLLLLLPLDDLLLLLLQQQLLLRPMDLCRPLLLLLRPKKSLFFTLRRQERQPLRLSLGLRRPHRRDPFRIALGCEGCLKLSLFLGCELDLPGAHLTRGDRVARCQ